MITKQSYDECGNLRYEEHDDGYFEENDYDSYGRLIKSVQHYTNGIIEIEFYRYNTKNESA